MQPGDNCGLKADALHLNGLTTTSSDVSNSLSTMAIHNQSTNTDSESIHKILLQTSSVDRVVNKPAVVRPIDGPFGWIPTLAAMVNFMFIFGAPNSYGVFSTYYLNTKFRDTPAATLSWIGTASTAFMLGLNIFSGPLADRIGYRQTAYIGTVICTSAYILASFSSKVWQLMLTQGILFGIGASFLLAPSNSIAPQWFDRHRGLASGVAIAGSSIGGLWFTAATQSIIDSMGPEWALRILGILTFIVTSVMNLLYIERVPPTPRKNIFELKVTKQLTFWLIILELFAAYTGYWALFFYIGTSAIQVKGTSQDGANLLLVLNACSAVGRVLLGFVADKFGSLNTLLFCLLLTVAIEMSLWITARSLAPLYVLCTIYGLVSSTFISLNPVIVAIYFSSSPLSSVLGMTNLSSGLGGLVGNLSQGTIFDKYDNRTQFTNTIIFSSMFLLLSAVAVLALRVHVIGKGSNKRLLQKI
ncbi:MFS general substrate transporter [Coemansia reversa NRRL 1564]|uniref:MFS general substrate transporter n=1 Tax=Coemansia reversa (strain ATCC 12441 / NRRL 1564) TaxID=763665 RepID=A0A2G5BHA5_COERN|nr:MFS general substrate transporter [Coemansia reversa NRRL 1564]|eukprot:PIA18371.1 MFS general substrate transporter [Coemansia reversa NRRL 1564]